MIPTSIIIMQIACGVVTFITRKNTKGNEFHLYRLYSAYEGSRLSTTGGIFSDMEKAGENQKELEDSTAPGIQYGISKVTVNTFKGREGNTVYEWKEMSQIRKAISFLPDRSVLRNLASYSWAQTMITRANSGLLRLTDDPPLLITTCEKTPSDIVGCGMNRTSFSFCISPS